MKKIKLIIIFISFVSIISSVFAFTPHRIKPVDIRAEGMGGSYFTDSESFYTLFSNPAGLAFVGEKTLWPSLSIGMGGPLEQLATVGVDAIAGDLSLDDSTALLGLMSGLLKDFGFTFNTRIGTPLTFGAIRNNFGWGLVNTVSVFAEAGITASDINAGFDLDLVFGYAVPLNLGPFGKLSIGFSGRGIAQSEMTFKGAPTALIEDNALETIPLNATFGFGFDMGVRYEVLNLINVALVWQDVYTPTWTKTFSSYNDVPNWESSQFEKGTIESKLGIGLGLDIPLEKITFGIISHFGIYANYSDLLPLFAEEIGISEHPILGLSVGAELVLYDVFAFRIGVTEMYPSAGLGIYMGNFRIDFSLYGAELGLEPGDLPQLNAGLSLAVHY